MSKLSVIEMHRNCLDFLLKWQLEHEGLCSYKKLDAGLTNVEAVGQTNTTAIKERGYHG